MAMLSYRIRKATTGVAPHPCILLLHGYGSNADDLFSFAGYLPDQLTVISLEAPLDTPFGGKAWYSIHFDAAQDKWSDLKEAEKSLVAITQQLEYFIKEYDLNPKDIGLMGFSQGAILSWSLLLDHPDQFRRAICMSGYINTQLLKKPLDEYQNVLAYASHGTNDSTVPYQWAESSVNQLRMNNPKTSFNSYPDGHNVSPENFRDLLEWISKTNLD
ncbi:MAG: alpha/beta hydrolase [Flavobacteriaceae bacterium]|tara:strand:+ start:661 stop:1308 length:648 start_codon:yes stop_codon:yes gene_type:complete